MDPLNQYCEEHSSQPDAALNDIYRSIALHTANPNMASTPYQGLLLQMLSQMVQPQVAVEIGSFAGYGAVCIARGVAQGGTLHVVEVDEEYEEIILTNAQRGGVADKINLHIGAALNVIPSLPNNIDFAFVDADKENYENYYHLLLPKMRRGGLIIFDNMLWYGRVLETPETTLRCDRSTRILQHLNQLITQDPRVTNILLPIRDGLMIVRVEN